MTEINNMSVGKTIEFLSAVKVRLNDDNMAVYTPLILPFEEIGYVTKVGQKCYITPKGATALNVLTEFYDKFGV